MIDISKLIDITNVNLIKLVQCAYELSGPQGYGKLHYDDGSSLSDEEAKVFVDKYETDSSFALSFDYIKGRSVNLYVYRKRNKLYMAKEWYDHTRKELVLLTDRVWNYNMNSD